MQVNSQKENQFDQLKYSFHIFSRSQIRNQLIQPQDSNKFKSAEEFETDIIFSKNGPNLIKWQSGQQVYQEHSKNVVSSNLPEILDFTAYPSR
jgi:hypothetical protein